MTIKVYKTIIISELETCEVLISHRYL